MHLDLIPCSPVYHSYTHKHNSWSTVFDFLLHSCSIVARLPHEVLNICIPATSLMSPVLPLTQIQITQQPTSCSQTSMTVSQHKLVCLSAFKSSFCFHDAVSLEKNTLYLTYIQSIARFIETGEQSSIHVCWFCYIRSMPAWVSSCVKQIWSNIKEGKRGTVYLWQMEGYLC